MLIHLWVPALRVRLRRSTALFTQGSMLPVPAFTFWRGTGTRQHPGLISFSPPSRVGYMQRTASFLELAVADGEESSVSASHCHTDVLLGSSWSSRWRSCGSSCGIPKRQRHHWPRCTWSCRPRLCTPWKMTRELTRAR